VDSVSSALAVSINDSSDEPETDSDHSADETGRPSVLVPALIVVPSPVSPPVVSVWLITPDAGAAQAYHEAWQKDYDKLGLLYLAGTAKQRAGESAAQSLDAVDRIALARPAPVRRTEWH
jgi:hypothetical protein